MDLSFTEEQQMIRDAAREFLARASGSEAVRAAAAGDSGFDPSVWRSIGEELGWCSVAIDEEFGGMGLGPAELALIQEEAGYQLLCAPFFSTVCLAANLLSVLGHAAARERYLPAIASGDLRLGTALPADQADWSASGLRASAQDDGWCLSGECHVVDGASAPLLLLPAQTEGQTAWFTVSPQAGGVEVRALDTWDATRRMAAVSLDGATAELRVDEPGADQAAGLARARLYIAAEQVGAAQKCLDLTTAYLAERKQFGRALASFQALKHRCARMMVAIEAARSAVRGASLAAETGVALRDCTAAKVIAGEALGFAAAESIQLHGGVGFTWEYDPQLYFKRARSSSHWLGDAATLRAELAAQAITGPLLPPAAAPDADPDAEFRQEVADWMAQHLNGEFAVLRHRGGPGDEEAHPELRKDWERELAAGGWIGVGWPSEVGGRGLSIARQVIFHEEYARAGGPGRMGHIGEGLIGPTLIAFGSEAQKARFLPRILDGTEFWCQGYSEPAAGSDLANVQTRCWQDADGSWRVQGQKVWTSLAQDSDWIFVIARSEPGSRGPKGLSFLLLPLDQPGITIQPIRQIAGSCEFNEVFFDEAVAQSEHVVGAPGEGWKVAMGLLEVERGVSTLGQQMHFAHEVQLILDAARANGRIDDPLVRDRIGRAWCGLRVMRYNALRMLSGGEGADGRLQLGREALIYKYYWSNWHRELGELAMDVLGAAGDVPADDFAVQRLQQIYFFSRADTIYAGTNEIQLNLIGERGLGMPREPRG